MVFLYVIFFIKITIKTSDFLCCCKYPNLEKFPRVCFKILLNLYLIQIKNGSESNLFLIKAKKSFYIFRRHDLDQLRLKDI